MAWGLGHLPGPFLNLVEKLIRAKWGAMDTKVGLGEIIQLDVIERLALQKSIFSGKKIDYFLRRLTARTGCSMVFLISPFQVMATILLMQ